MINIEKRNGLIFSHDFKTVIGIDSESSLFSGVVPNGVKYIEEEAFSGSGLTRISLPESVESVGSRIFSECTNLEWVHLPSGLSKLSSYMFNGCSSLIHIDMPLAVEGFPEGLFCGCSSLTDIPFRRGITVLKEDVFSGCHSLVSLVIPETVRKICKNAISNCSNLRTLVLPAGLEIIEDGAVSNCSKLAHIRISNENQFFCTDEKENTLYSKNENGTKSLVFTLSDCERSPIPQVSEIDEEENRSVIKYDENDGTEDFIDVFENDEISEEENENLSGNNKNSENETGINNMNENTLDSISTTEEIINTQTKIDTAPEDIHETIAGPVSANSVENMEEKLAEILGQAKTFGSGDFQITDIPEASEEEQAAAKLSPALSLEDDELSGECFANNFESEENSIEESFVSSGDTLESDEANSEEENYDLPDENTFYDDGNSNTEAVITTDKNTDDDFSTENNASETELSDGADFNNCTECTLQENITVEDNSENPSSEQISAEQDFTENTDAEEKDDTAENEKVIIQNIFFEAAKVLQQNTNIEGEEKILYIFADNLSDGTVGKTFSKRLVNCCNRLAKIHNYTKLFFFYGIKLENEKFRNQFTQFMANKDALYACSAENVSSLDESQKLFAQCTGISLNPLELEAQAKNASNQELPLLKLIIQDNLS